ncbi:exonuclease SbcCD subunit D [Oryzihumus leptocrescens]|uniref:Nuclease SbcCD subunit D n=1 Tax=Oryzihumus leptocrescens TaxID=297536 RepID=A0A542ZLC0_9MICO|nr:exonuclease SbcCD subunit D [Oryzihumus leptocrescens]TQL60960.1 exodeoxyribonuclease I subunit D [Oryzihumus leptocrescens]
MKFLHTADWHVGKVLKGQPRHDEHEAVLGHLVELANAEDVDAILIPGDLFDSATPSPKAQGLVIETLLALRGHGRHVVAIAGNHDNGHLLDAVYRPLLGELGLHLLGTPKRPDAGGAVTLTTRAGEVVNVAVLPFLSHRYAVRAAETLLRETSEHTLSYSRRVREMVAALTAGFTPDAVNIVMTHGTLLGGRRGGGERDVQTSLDYELPATVFPASAHYTALGHLHRSQDIEGACPIAYSGSPLAIDFGEESNESVALVVTATPDTRATVRRVPVVGGRPLITLRGTLDEVVAAGEQAAHSWLRVVLAEPARAGLGDLVRGTLPNALEVQLDEAHRVRPGGQRAQGSGRLGRSPQELFTDYLTESNIDDPRIARLFGDLLDEITSPPDAPLTDQEG